jgi:hypothetical protein
LKTTPALVDIDGDGYWREISTTGSQISPNSNFKTDCNDTDFNKRIIWDTCTDSDNDGYCVSNITTSTCLYDSTSTAREQAASMGKNLIINSQDIGYETTTYGDPYSVTQTSTSYYQENTKYTKDNKSKNIFESILDILSSLIKGIISQIKIKEAYARPPCEMPYDDCVWNPLPPLPPSAVSWNISTEDGKAYAYLSSSATTTKYLIIPIRFSLPTTTISGNTLYYGLYIIGAPNSTNVEIRIGYKESDVSWSVSKSSKSYTISGTTTISDSFTPGFLITSSDLNSGRIALFVKASNTTASGYITILIRGSSFSVFYSLSGYKGPNDCYDGNPEARPGQTKYFGVPRGNNDNSFDYNCDGFSEQLEPSQCSGGPIIYKPLNNYVYNTPFDFLKKLFNNLIKTIFARPWSGGGSYYICWVTSPIPGCGGLGNKCYKTSSGGSCIGHQWQDVQLCR